MSSDSLFGDVIFSYSRHQAIADGVLVDLTQNEVVRLHWKIPMACTSAVWEMIAKAVDTDGHDLNGILHDVSSMAKLAIRANGHTDIIFFSAIVAGRKHSLKLHIGPGDTPAPVLTLMFPHED